MPCFAKSISRIGSRIDLANLKQDCKRQLLSCCRRQLMQSASSFDEYWPSYANPIRISLKWAAEAVRAGWHIARLADWLFLAPLPAPRRLLRRAVLPLLRGLVAHRALNPAMRDV